jgi:isoleucyl-tRNA synthetase
MRASDEILQRVTDGYRKLRNTARFALGNLDGFDPARDSVPEAEMEEIDRWALAELNALIRDVRKAYEAYEFHSVFHEIYQFCTVTLSARYFDILKDRLYTYAPRNVARRSAQTVIHRIVDALARFLAPILSFTADEIWENIPRSAGDDASVHLALFPEFTDLDDRDLVSTWTRLFAIRDQVLGELEKARVNKIIGSSLEAKLTITEQGDFLELLRRYYNDLRYIFIVSQVELLEGPPTIAVSRAEGEKCERCWNYSTRVGESERYPTVCERCLAALSEIEQEESRINE